MRGAVNTFDQCLGAAAAAWTYAAPLVTLASGECLRSSLGSAVTDGCDGYAAAWRVTSYGPIENDAGLCVDAELGAAQCGRSSVLNATRSTSHGWRYGADGQPGAGAPVTVVSGAGVAGEWMQDTLAAGATISAYSVAGAGGHVLAGAYAPAGPWAAVGNASAAGSFAVASRARFTDYRLIVTRASNATAVDFALTHNPQIFSAVPKPSGPGPIAWTVVSADPWALPAVTAATLDVTALMAISDPLARYAAAVPLIGSDSAAWPISAGANALYSSSFTATANFTFPACAGLLVYDALDRRLVSAAASGTVYHVILITDGTQCDLSNLQAFATTLIAAQTEQSAPSSPTSPPPNTLAGCSRR